MAGMRIAFVVSSYHPQVGGVEIHVRNIAEACAKRGDQVTVLTHRNDAAHVTEETVNGVRVLRFPPVSSSPNYAFAPGLFRYLRSHAADFDIIHSHSYHTVVGQASIGIGLPFVFTPHYHGTGHTPFRAFLHRVYRPVGARQFKAADAVICVSAAERGLVVKDFPATSDKITIIPNGTDRRVAQPEPGQAAPPVPVLLTVGRLERYKNLDLVIKAFAALRVAATLVIVGDGPDRERLEEVSRSVGKPASIRFTGRIPDRELDILLAQATVVTSASEHEAFGLVLTEGLSAGARVVASDIAAHREVGQLVGDASPITFVDVNNTPQYAAALEQALGNGRIPAGTITFPSWSEVADRTRSLYLRLVSEKEPVHRVRREEHV
jgi:glycosyltransferase involved in cell wall biosynthesis